MQGNAAVPGTCYKAENVFSKYKTTNSLTVPASYIGHYSTPTIAKIVVAL